MVKGLFVDAIMKVDNSTPFLKKSKLPNPKLIAVSCASCRFIGEKQKSSLWLNLVSEKRILPMPSGLALHQGYEVMMVHANTLIDDLYRFKADGRYQTALKRYKRLEIFLM